MVTKKTSIKLLGLASFSSSAEAYLLNIFNTIYSDFDFVRGLKNVSTVPRPSGPIQGKRAMNVPAFDLTHIKFGVIKAQS